MPDASDVKNGPGKSFAVDVPVDGKGFYLKGAAHLGLLCDALARVVADECPCFDEEVVLSKMQQMRSFAWSAQTPSTS